MSSRGATHPRSQAWAPGFPSRALRHPPRGTWPPQGAGRGDASQNPELRVRAGCSPEENEDSHLPATNNGGPVHFL